MSPSLFIVEQTLMYRSGKGILQYNIVPGTHILFLHVSTIPVMCLRRELNEAIEWRMWRLCLPPFASQNNFTLLRIQQQKADEEKGGLLGQLQVQRIQLQWTNSLQRRSLMALPIQLQMRAGTSKRYGSKLSHQGTALFLYFFAFFGVFCVVCLLNFVLYSHSTYLPLIQ